LRFDEQNGKLLSTTMISAHLGREVGAGLFDPGTRHPELLLATHGSAVTWKRPLSGIFTLPGASTDWGWNFDRIDRVGSFVGSPGWTPVRTTRTRIVLDLTHSMTAGFRITDGSVVWRTRRTTYMCGLLPCSGTDQASYSSPGEAQPGGTTVGVRFREVGTISAPRAGGLAVADRDARVTLEGFEPRNGQTLWTFDAGHDVGLITLRRLPPQVGTTTIVLREKGRRTTAVDLADGSHRPIPRTAAGWCREPILYKLRLAGASVLYVGQFALFTCAANGERLTTPTHAPAFVGSIGARIDDLVIWSTRGAIIAVPATG
jgi:hypothetical protein